MKFLRSGENSTNPKRRMFYLLFPISIFYYEILLKILTVGKISLLGTLFLFCGRRRDRIKALYWEGNGFVLLYKRSENGELPVAEQASAYCFFSPFFDSFFFMDNHKSTA